MFATRLNPLRVSAAPSIRRNDSKPPQSILADQDKRTVARPAPKARGAVERNLEGLGSQFRGSLARGENMALGQAAEKEQRNVQALRRDELAVEFMGAFEHACQPVNSLGCARVGNGCEK